MIENIYALCHGPESDPVFFYVGKCIGTVEARYEQHTRGARDHTNSKPAYEYMRQTGVELCRVVHLDTTESGLAEADYVKQLILLGHPLQNANAGNRKVAAKRTAGIFSTTNRLADARLEAAERRNRLHSDAQVLSKPEIVRQRVLGELPSAEILAGLDWRSAPPELMAWGKPPKNPDEIDCKMLKFGDLNIFIAFKKTKWAYWVKNAKTGLADTYKVNWQSRGAWLDHAAACKIITEQFPTFFWWTVYQR